MAMWLPNLVFFLLTFFLIHKVAQETHTLFLEKFYDFSHAVYRRIPWISRRTV
jgi:hypothetical protein